MSVLTVDYAKRFLDVIHDADDAKLQDLLDGAEDEALRFMNRTRFSGECSDDEPATDPDTIPPSIKVAVLLLLQATYQAGPDDADKLRKAAEIKLMPRRCEMGV